MADKKGKKEASPDDIMSTAEMKPILAKAKRGDPVSCVIALTKDKEGVILVDKKKKPKKLRSDLKKMAEDAGLEIEMTSVRFGRASVDTDEDAGLVTFTVNKDASGAMRPKLLERVKKAGFTKVEIIVDAAVEAESESDDDDLVVPAAAAGAAAAAQSGVESGAQAPVPPPAAAAPDMPAAADTPAAPPPAAGPQAAPAPAAAAPAAGQPAAAQPAGGDMRAALQEITKTVAGLMKLIPDAVAHAPAEKGQLVELAAAANAAIKASDLAKATEIAEELEEALKAITGQAPQGAAAGQNGAAQNAAQNGAGQNGTAASAAAAKLKTSSLAWAATRKAVEGQIGTLHGKMVEAYKDHGFGADLDKFFKSKVEPVLEQLDESLVEALADVGRATEAGQQKGLVEQAQKIVARYEGYVASEPLIKKLDNNPFVDLKIEETLSKTLMALNKTLTSVASNLNT